MGFGNERSAFAMCLFSESWKEISLSVPRRYTNGGARVIHCMSLESTGEAQSKDTVMGVSGVLFSYETGKTHPGEGRQRKEVLGELSLGNIAVIRGVDDEPKSARQREDAKQDERKTRREVKKSRDKVI